MDRGVFEINEKLIIELFLNLVNLDSPSTKERFIADFIMEKLKTLGLETSEDKAGASVKGDSGNVIGFLKGNQKGKSILLSAHMDTVISNQGVKTNINNRMIRTDGTTILGGDDKAGITAILEVLRIIKEKNLGHGDIYVVFTIAEELGLYGAKNLDLTNIKADIGLVLDSSGPVGTVVYNAPAEDDFVVKVFGKAAHAGVNPEAGVNAIKIAGRAIDRIGMGRIDNETTVNIGLIKGGYATNIVPDLVEIRGEIRSRSYEKIDKQFIMLEQIFADVCQELRGSYQLQRDRIYEAYKIDPQESLLQMVAEGAKKIGIKYQLIASGGGSDANILNQKGLPCLNIGVGMYNDHTNEEFISIDDLINSVKLLLAIIDNTTIDAGI